MAGFALVVDLADESWALTGAAGQIASALRPALAERVASLRLLDVAAPAAEHEHEEARAADLRDGAAMRAALTGADGVIHLGGLAGEADVHDLAEVNILGTAHVLEAARLNGCRRVVFASTNHVTGYYASGARVTVDLPVRPDSFYGVSKAAGEALGRMYSEKFGLSVICLRIGSFEAAPSEPRHLSTWLSHRDALAALVAAMTSPLDGFAVLYAVSRNTRGWWDLAAGDAIGYHPADDAETHAGSLPAGPLYERQGGEMCPPEYTLERQRPIEERRPS